MMRLVVAVCALGVAVWLGQRLWPAVRTEPSTWLGEDWRTVVRERVGA